MAVNITLDFFRSVDDVESDFHPVAGRKGEPNMFSIEWVFLIVELSSNDSTAQNEFCV